MDLLEEMNKLIKELDYSVKQLRKNGTALAEAEKNYKMCLMKEALKLREIDEMPVTLINQVIYGVKEVATLRFERDVKEATYLANQEAINSTKLKIRILESQLNREYTITK